MAQPQCDNCNNLRKANLQLALLCDRLIKELQDLKDRKDPQDLPRAA